MKIPFSPPYIDQEVIDEVVDTLKSGWITTGPKVKLLEEEVCKLTRVEHTVCVNSWTSGAILIFKWFGIGPGDEVIVPAYTYSATALAVLHVGAKPVMVDVGQDFTINTTKILEAINERTKIIMPVDIAGWPCDYDEITKMVLRPEVIAKFNPQHPNQQKLGRILTLSDAAHSIGAFYKNVPVGQLADITIFSLHAVKNVTTAEGGVICLNLPSPFSNQDEYKVMKLFTLNGQNKDAFTKSQAGGWKYDILFEGLKVNMPDVCAAIGLAQIRKYDSHLLKERLRVAESYQNFFSQHEHFELPLLKNEDKTSCYHIYALRINGVSEDQRDAIIEKVTERGVSVNVHFIPMPMLTVFKNLGYDISNYPKAFDNYSREISLPIYPQLTEIQIKYICDSIQEAYLEVIND